MIGNKRKSKNKKTNPHVMTEEEAEKYMMGHYNMSFIAGYTDGGVPYGTGIDEKDLESNETCLSDEIPF